MNDGERSVALPREAKGARGRASGASHTPDKTTDGERSVALPREAKGARGRASGASHTPDKTTDGFLNRRSPVQIGPGVFFSTKQ